MIKVHIDNVKECKNKDRGWYAIFDLILEFGEGRTIRIGCCGVEFVRNKPYLRLPTKIRQSTGEPYQLNFFDDATWKEMVKTVSDHFGGVAR